VEEEEEEEEDEEEYGKLSYSAVTPLEANVTRQSPVHAAAAAAANRAC